MRAFFKIFFASFLALIVFTAILFFFFIAVVGAMASKDAPQVAERSVLQIDLSEHFSEQARNNPLSRLSGGERSAPGLYDVVRLIRHAATDEKISGIYLVANDNANGYAASEELRAELLAFRQKKKFVIAHGDRMSQKAYYVASGADRVYLSPQGALDWKGLSVELLFFKNALDRLNIRPQVFYAGKFKSATEPFRAERMTPENRLQTTEWLNDLYNVVLQRAAAARRTDTARLRRIANEGLVQNADDALREGLVDALKYDDQVRDELKGKVGAGKYDKLHFITLDDYKEVAAYRGSGDRIALIYAEGNIIDGKGDNESIGDADYIKWIRKARLDKSIKAIVFRVNSGGGSALASEHIWRELTLAKADKPLVVSFGDVAASGGYYIGTAADSIFALPNTITGSIGVFTMIPEMGGFFNEKLGITFDGVKTGTYADAPNVFRPMTAAEGALAQREVDRIYSVFKQRVATGRRKDIAYIDSIAQGRVYSGARALELGLVDRIGSLDDAVRCAARLAKTDGYRLREYPEEKGWFSELLDREKEEPAVHLQKQLGAEQFAAFRQLVELNRLCRIPQARVPFQLQVR
ncbi:signal peptide peptidase SppA [Flaviaesturariibacter amylovorans]|uniref:Signal peptide peptidase SppA n=1 Tax=Flaviaesturariibacter amylovorans TaxID=1084520 RepID=A0ABP8GGU9_9BACT